ncbi:MAG TPA: transglycosylase SLT domain-containing protein [Candidatus Gastranaerophilaceae bacterium]|nr:transglycosylase SLT domain-containing protein [Candidatus Gastranaerophilaceae bacterium]HPT41618.1 transglycosylase SLT domain-containing protein [Candidatus Gastranaerophilaceae bacterium]
MISRQKITLIAIIIFAVIAIAFINTPKIWTPESISNKKYTQALEKYKNNDLSQAYADFEKIPKTSKLKPAALYRQAFCAEQLSDKKGAIKKYNEIIKKYKNSKIALKAKYSKAQYLYEEKSYKKAKKEFKEIIRKYPQSDYALASGYYMGSIETLHIERVKNKKKKNKTIKKASHYFRNYLKEAPSGRFSINCIEKWILLNKKLKNEDNLIIAKSYMANGDFKNAQKYLNYTNINISWPYFVQNAYSMKDYSKVKYYTQFGLKEPPVNAVAINEAPEDTIDNKAVYDAIDTYLSISQNPKTSISYLLSLSENAPGHDYLLYKNCLNMPQNLQLACFNTLYRKYPKGQFAAESLSNIFYEKIKTRDYYTAKKIGSEHLSNFPKTNSTPRVMFWLAKINEKTKNYDIAINFYKNLILQFPDDYYAYHSYLNLNGFKNLSLTAEELENKEILFPYKKNSENELIIKLAQVKDWGLINELCKDDDFIQSWLKYQQGDFSSSARIARDAMDKLETKPDRKDPRWRLVYPIHFYKEIKENAKIFNNNPVLILSIIREESYFNPKSISPVGAMGLMQLMPITASEVGKDRGINLLSDKFLLQPDINIKIGNIYYSRLRKVLFDKDILAVLAYNGGIGSVSRWKEDINFADIDDFVEQIPYLETQNYLKKVYKSYWNYVRIYSND